MTLPTLPNLSLSAGGGTGGASSSAGIGTPISSPINFDSAGWTINFGDGNTTRAQGGSDANATSQTGTPNRGLSGLLGGVDPLLIVVVIAAVVLLRK